MSDLRDRLARLGLSQYFEAFAAEGFDTWETVLDITESDLSHLSVKLGHRRKLQRAIAESRGQSTDRPLPIALGRAASTERSYRSDDSGPENKGKQGDTPTSSLPGTATKRKYRRHPKPDEHAPERPPSAYVIFSNQVRESLKGQELTFTEIAKVVGERWQVLPADERESCERQANGAKEKYYAELADYKKTPQFEVYQKYLDDFKAKHAAPAKGKRSKLETERTISTPSSSHDQTERAANQRLSSAQPELPGGYQRLDPSPPIGPARLPPGPSYSSKPTSPASHSLSGLNSPRTGGDMFPSISASPRSAVLPKEPFHDTSSTNPVRGLRSSMDAHLPYHPYTDPHYQPASTTPPSNPYVGSFQNPVELHPRRPMRDATRLPPLSHEDTTLSSESGHSGHSISLAPYSGPGLPTDSIKTLRTLPQPIPSIGPSPSPLDRPPPPQLPLPAPSSQYQSPTHDYRTQGPLAVLVRAGELAARIADDEAMDIERSP